MRGRGRHLFIASLGFVLLGSGFAFNGNTTSTDKVRHDRRADYPVLVLDVLVPQLDGVLAEHTHLLALHAVFQYASDTSRAYYGDIAQYAKATRDAEIARQRQIVQRRTVRVVPQPPRTVGACGGATNGADQFIGRESGGDPTVYNGGGHSASPYASNGRAWGCYQIMPFVWDANCRDLGFDVAGQAACASRLSLSAWGG